MMRILLLLVVILLYPGASIPVAQAPPAAPKFQVDPAWPKIPNNWQFGQVASVAIDAQDHVWVLQRPGTLSPEEKPKAAPPLLEFDAAGNFIQAWGGPGQGYDWPSSEHGVYVDPKGFVWIGGNGEKDNHILKFTKAGKFVMQIGKPGQSTGNADTRNLNQPADTFVHARTNELFVADGYGNRRVIVFDADTGAFKRMWGAFGNVPTDAAPNPALPDADEKGAPQFVQPVHAARVSNDGFVYVSDRGGKRVQVFTIDGKYVNQVFIGRDCKAPECGNGTTAASTAFSTDAEQRFLYVGNRSQAKVMVFDRKTLALLDSFGRWGSAPGEFGTLHHMAADSKGNLYVTEVTPLKPENRRIQKFTLMPAAQASRDTAASHLAAAKAAAGQEHTGLFDRLCTLPPPAPAAAAPAPAAAPSGAPDRSLWHAEPAKVFDNLYYVGEKEYSAWAVTTSAGIIIIDAIFDYSVEDEIVGGLKKLGLDPAQIKYVLVSHGHSDHVAGARHLQEKFGARVIMSADDWDLVERTRAQWPKPKRDMVATDGQRLTLGDTTLTMYITPGHTLGTISTLIPVKDGGRTHLAAAWGGTAFNWLTNRPMYITPERTDTFWFDVYGNSARRFRDIVAKANADVLIANHTNFDGTKVKVPALAKRRPGDPHPYVIGNASVQRYLTVADECAKAGLLAR